ncbi:hypothetical protein CLOM_g19945 [Closterium sp. NIES-68]|nr:hypothetical protein CLOM_g19945 [Closterium sp. NIES-68]
MNGHSQLQFRADDLDLPPSSNVTSKGRRLQGTLTRNLHSMRNVSIEDDEAEIREMLEALRSKAAALKAAAAVRQQNISTNNAPGGEDLGQSSVVQTK